MERKSVAFKMLQMNDLEQKTNGKNERLKRKYRHQIEMERIYGSQVSKLCVQYERISALHDGPRSQCNRSCDKDLGDWHEHFNENETFIYFRLGYIV